GGLVLDAVIVVIDAATVRQRAADRYVGDTVTAQLAQADLIVVNKLDLVAAGFCKDLTAWLQGQAPAARVAHACQGEVPVELILGSSGSQARDSRVPVRAAALSKARSAKAPLAEDECAQATGGQHLRRILPPAADRFTSITFRFSEPVDMARLATELADPVLGILRSKGLMRDNDGTPTSFQQVGSRTQTCNLAYPDPDCGRLVCIGLRDSLDEAAIGLRLQAAPPAGLTSCATARR
ncbi:MAG: GTP-binding protein, partial [Lautropia sp.]|nr:GTP-binding protein [Lautropia sp.]